MSVSAWKAFPRSALGIPISACSGLTSTRTRVRNHREAALYAGPFICEDKTEIGSAASARSPASICHGDATHRYRLARPRNYPRRARILQRTLVIYRAARPRVTPSRTSATSLSLSAASSSSSAPPSVLLLSLLIAFVYFAGSFAAFPDDCVHFDFPVGNAPPRRRLFLRACFFPHVHPLA